MMDFGYSFTEKWDEVATWKHYIYSLPLCMMSNALLTCNHAKELFLFHQLREWDELKMIMVENIFIYIHLYITLGEIFFVMTMTLWRIYHRCVTCI